MTLTRNRKQLVGSAIFLTASAFMLAAYGTFDRVPLAFLVLYLLATGSFCVLTLLSQRELKNPNGEARKTKPEAQIPRST
jgi:hypothetical protein